MMTTTRGTSDLIEPPMHGNRGNREPAAALSAPLGISVAISREAGARGGSIARRLGKRLGWQVYTQELLEFLSGNESARAHVLADLPTDAAPWVDSQIDRLRQERIVASGSTIDEMPRLILTLAARGGVILVGRGAGYLLPRESSLHVRVFAPLEDRVAYMSQVLRRTQEEAAEQVRDRDEQRAEFLVKSYNRRTGDLHDYDMVLNSYLLGEETCTDLVLVAIRAKERHLGAGEED